MGGRSIKPWKWTRKREIAMHRLALGDTMKQASETAGIAMSTLVKWKRIPEFMEEVDRVTMISDIAWKAERVRLAMRAVRQLVHEEGVKTDKDLLDWLKYAQSETDGATINVTPLVEAFLEMAGAGQTSILAPDSSEESAE